MFDNTPSPLIPPFLTIALEWAKAGVPVFPCQPGGKAPLTQHGHLDATRETDVITEWWTSRWPQANVGLSVGAAGLGVLDLDVRHGHDGPAALRQMAEAAKAVVPPTYRVATPSGGEHVYFLAPPGGLPSRAGRLAPGIDTRGLGGYVLAAGSVLDDRPGQVPGTYQVVEVGAYAPWPSWYVPVGHHGASSGHLRGCSSLDVEVDQPEAVARARRVLAETRLTGDVSVEGSGGSDRLYRMACTLRDLAVSEARAAELLVESGWNAACQPPWAVPELESHVEHAYRYAQNPLGIAAPSETALSVAESRAREHQIPNTPETQKLLTSRFGLLFPDDQDRIPPPQWLIENTFTHPSIAVLYGQWGSYKTFLALDFALSLASGRPWATGQGLEQNTTSREKRRVLYIAGEGVAGLRSRRQAWQHFHSIPSDTIADTFALMPTIPLFADDKDLSQALSEMDQYKPEFIVIDTVALAMGGMDENLQKDMSFFFSRLVRIKDLFQATILSIHHTGKDVAKGMRGSNVLPANADTVVLAQARRNNICQLTMEKQKDAAKWPRALRFCMATGHGDSLVPIREGVRPVTPDTVVPVTEEEHEQQVARQTSIVAHQDHATWAQAAIDVLLARRRDGQPLPVGLRSDFPGQVATVVGVDRELIRGFLRHTAWRMDIMRPYIHSLGRSGKNRVAESYTVATAREEGGFDEN